MVYETHACIEVAYEIRIYAPSCVELGYNSE